MKAVYEGNCDYLICKVQSNKGSELYALLTIQFQGSFPVSFNFVNFKLTPSLFRYYSRFLVSCSFERLMALIGAKEDYFDNETFELF